MAKVYVSIGSNVIPELNIQSALRALKSYFNELQCSSVYQSQAEGFEGPDFLNMVVAFETYLSPIEVVNAFKGIEQQHGRSPESPSFSDRTLDLDLLLYDDLVMIDIGLELPRSEIERYAFVLCPLAEIAGEERHPVTGQSFQTMWDTFEGRRYQPLTKVEFTIE